MANLIEPIKVVGIKCRQHLSIIFFYPLGKRHDMWFYYIQTGLAILAAAQEIMVIQLVFVGIINIMHYLLLPFIRAKYGDENVDVDVFFHPK